MYLLAASRMCQRAEEHHLEDRAGDGEQDLVGGHVGAVRQLEGDVSEGLLVVDFPHQGGQQTLALHP